MKLTQCMAILRHLGRKHGLAPKTDEERIRTDQAAVQFLDIRNSFCRLCYGEDFVRRFGHAIIAFAPPFLGQQSC